MSSVLLACTAVLLSTDDLESSPRLTFRPALEIFSVYRFQLFPAGQDGGSEEWFHEFDLERTLAWLDVELGPVTARVMLEAAAGADEAGLLAVAGDSTILRIREAWVGYEAFDRVQVKAGVVQTLAQPEVELSEGLRAIGMGPHERFDLLFPADAGATVTGQLPFRLGKAGAGIYSGESYRSRELNRGKTTELLLRLTPLAPFGFGEALNVVAGYLIGSRGAGSSRADRVTGVLSWYEEHLHIGAGFTYALGFDGDGSREGYLLHGYVRAELDRLILGARAYRFQRDVAADDDVVTTLEGAVGWELFGPLEGYLSVGRDLLGDRAAAALPGLDAWTFSLIARLRVGD